MLTEIGIVEEFEEGKLEMHDKMRNKVVLEQRVSYKGTAREK